MKRVVGVAKDWRLSVVEDEGVEKEEMIAEIAPRCGITMESFPWKEKTGFPAAERIKKCFRCERKWWSLCSRQCQF